MSGAETATAERKDLKIFLKDSDKKYSAPDAQYPILWFSLNTTHIELDFTSQFVYTELMSSLYSDTDPRMEALQIQLLRQASPTKKMHMVAQLNTAGRLLALTGLRSRFPQATESELHYKLAVLFLGEELVRKVYGDSDHAK